MKDRLLTTKDAAKELGVTDIRVRALIYAGRLKAEKLGRDYVIKESSLDQVRDRKPGRPRISNEHPPYEKTKKRKKS